MTCHMMLMHRRATGEIFVCRETMNLMEHDPHPRELDDDAMQAMIGKQLRTLYDSVLAEPIPDNIVSLLTQLDDLTSDGIDSADEDDEASGGAVDPE